MTATLVCSAPTGSDEWHAARVGKMTGSRIASVMDLSPFESRFSLWYRMRGEVGPAEVNPAMEWGNRLEDAVCQKFADEHPELHVSRTGLWQNDSRPWQVGTPDRLVTYPSWDAILEAKTARYDDGWGEPGTDEIPVWYRAQVLWYLDTLGLKVAHVAVLISGSDYREYVVRKDRAAMADIKQMRMWAQAFLADLRDGVRPDIDAHGQTYQVIRELHPDIDPTSIDIDSRLGAEIVASKTALDIAKDRHQEAKSRLADVMGSVHYAYFNGAKIADRRAKGLEGTPYVQLARTLPTALKESA